MNNKGFTIIELVGIIMVLALIFLVSFPALQNIERNDKDASYDKMIKNLCLAGESYILSNEEEFRELNEITISINELISYGNVDVNLKNPRTKNSIKGDDLKFTVLEDNSFECEYIDN